MRDAWPIQYSQQIIESAPEGIVVYGLDLRYQVWNPFMERLTGMPANRVLGRHPLDLFPLLAEAEVIAGIERVLAGEAESNVDLFFHVPQTGRGAWIQHISAPLLDVHGKVAGVLSMVRDFTKRKQAEEVLTKSRSNLGVNLDVTERKRAQGELEERMEFEELLADISATFLSYAAEEMDTAIDRCLEELVRFLEVDRANVTEFNSDRSRLRISHSYAIPANEPLSVDSFSIEDMPWYAGQILAGNTWFYRNLPDDLPDEAVAERQFCIAHGLKGHVAIPLKSGDAHLGLVAFQFLKRRCEWQPEILARLKLVGEIIANALIRKNASRSLRGSESRFRTLFEDAPVAIGIGRDGVQFHANRAYVRMFGFDRLDEVVDRPIADFWAPEWRAIIDRRARQRSAGLPVVSEYDAIAQRKDGTQFPVHLVATMVQLPDGRATMAFLTDLTERRRAEEELQEMQMHLAHVARLSTLGEMAAELAHELNHPLYAILNYAKAARNVLAEEGPPDLDSVREWTEEIAGTAVSAAEVIKRLRAFARRGDAPRTSCRIEEIVEEAVGLVAIELRRARVKLETSFAADVPPVLVDRVQIQQVLVNLLSNAIDAVEALSADRRTVAIAASPGNAELEVVVSDRGAAGLPPGMEAKIFEPFMTTKPDGLGMGLSITRTIIEACGGRLWAEPCPECGAAFHFTLPLHDGAQPDGI